MFIKRHIVLIGISLFFIGLPELMDFPMVGSISTFAVVMLWARSAWLQQNQIHHLLSSSSVTNDQALSKLIDEYLDSIRACIDQEVSRQANDLQQIKTLVADAVHTMSTGFQGLNHLVKDQSKVVNSLMRDFEGSTSTEDIQINTLGFAQFAQETDNVMRFFIEHILMISKQSVQMVGVINDVGHNMARVEKLLSDVQSIADQTNLLALNAAIEAARAGEAGRGFAVVADEVRNLSRNSDKFSEQIKVVVNDSKSNIHQAQDMIAGMASRDMNLTISSKANIDKMMGDIAIINSKIAGNMVAVSELTERIDENLGRALRGLQFEDMTRQVADHLQEKITHFQALADELTVGFGTFKSEERGVWVSGMKDAITRVNDMKQQWDDLELKAVNQTSMDEGEVDFF